MTSREASRPAGARPARLWFLLADHRSLLQAVGDALAWVAAVAAMMMVRLDLSGWWDGWRPGSTAAAFVVLQLGVGYASGLYQHRFRFGSFDEVAALTRVVALVGFSGTVVAVAVAGERWVPFSVAVGAAAPALVIMAGTRFSWRLVLERRNRPGRDARAVVVFGAGDAGAQVIAAMHSAPDGSYRPVAILDDDPRKQNLRIQGVAVAGTRNDLTAVVARTGAELLVVAAPSLSSAVVRELSNAALALDLPLRSLPPISDLIDGTVGLGDLRPLTETDLMGRHAVSTDVASITDYVEGRTVLVTGAGGSIGSELCVQLRRFGVTDLVMLDRDESALHALVMRLDGRSQLDDRNLVVADIRDLERMHEVMADRRPSVVFHAAALKHVPLLELHPSEGLKTNVRGTLNVLEAAGAAGVERFVNISSDKAAEPANVLGYTKRLGERLAAHYAERHPSGGYLSVRFGNVLGSRGSMLGVFEAQAAAGGPITVTHPEVTRYFMTVPEAVELVIQAGAIGSGGEVLVLDMGEPVAIADVARRIAAQAEPPVEIVYTGLRPGEKLHEVLFARDECSEPSGHRLISRVAAAPLGAESLGLLGQLDGPALVEAMKLLCATPDPVDLRRSPALSGRERP